MREKASNPPLVNISFSLPLLFFFSLEGDNRLIGMITTGRAAYVTKEPYGVILEIVPWNAPIILLIRAIFFPVACGNSVIIKASETSPRTHFLVTSIAAEAGFPPGVINIISHAREDAVVITNALIEHEVVKKISFTGSSAVARKLAAKAGQCLKPILLELGGKAPLIVMEDADLEAAAKDAALGSFMHVSYPQEVHEEEEVLTHLCRADKCVCPPRRSLFTPR